MQALNAALPPIADVYVGQVQIPYYLDPAAPLTGHWDAAPGGPPGGVPSTNLTRFNPVPVAKATLGIPLFVTVPNGASGHAKPGTGWPVVIFQHGLQGNRTQAAAIAGAYASQGFVVAAIDIPLHGITDTTSPLYQAGVERTFDLDIDGTPGIDPSGSYIINLTSLLTSRDNLREAAVDIVQLSKSLPNLDLDGDTVPDIDAAQIHYSSISLGSIVGTIANAMPISTVSAYLNVPGGGVANLLRDSQALGPVINNGLAAKGLNPGFTLYEQFFRDAQTVVDAGDPINYIAAAVAARPVLVSQVLNDAVIPNTATQRLINAAPFVKTAAPGIQFRRGGHGHLGALHVGLARLAPEPGREPGRDHRNADARGLARRVRGRRVRDHEPGHPGTLTAAEGGFFARLRARVNRGAVLRRGPPAGPAHRRRTPRRTRNAPARGGRRRRGDAGDPLRPAPQGRARRARRREGARGRARRQPACDPEARSSGRSPWTGRASPS